jgi:hypothetical protein
MNRIKLPKRLAGVKIPKSVRKGAVRDFLNSPAGQLRLVEGLNAAAVAAEQSDHPVEDRLAGAVREALVTFRQALGVPADTVFPDQPPGAGGPD